MKNIGASIRARLLNKAHATGEDFTYMLLQYAMERLLFRIGASRFREKFLLKGASLFAVWFKQPYRRTQDIDLLGYGENSSDALVATFTEIVTMSSNDGMVFDKNSITGEIIKERDEYQGIRLTLLAYLDSARIPLIVEVGFGDMVTPMAETIHFPVLLDTKDVPILYAYPMYTVLAEKLHTIVTKGILNSRMKDFYDVWFLSYTALDYSVLQRAIKRTFEQRNTSIDISDAVGLTDSFANNAEKQRQWNAFAKNTNVVNVALTEVVTTARNVFERAFASG